MSMAALRWARKVGQITSTQKLVLVMLADMANDYAEAWPSAGTLAGDCCLSERAVRAALEGLEKAGLVVGEKAIGRATRWVVQIGSTPEPRAATPEHRSETPEPRSEVGAKEPTPEPRSDLPRNHVPGTPEPRSDRTLSNPHTTPNDLKLVIPADAGDPFEAWWLAYPRKVGKDKARKAYAAALKRGASHAVLAYAICRQSWSDDKTFIPHAATWLNQGRWQDVPTDAAPPPVKRESNLSWMAGMFGDLPADDGPGFDFDLTAEEIP